MCYNAAYIKQKMIKRAEHDGLTIDEIVLPRSLYYVSAFSHPDIPVITTENPNLVQSYTWGLIPEWSKDIDTAIKMQRSTPNARSESIYTKPSFRDPTSNGQRCVIMSTGFFEYYHRGSKKFPYFVEEKDQDVTFLAGLYSHWNDKKTVTILTTEANELMTGIHNNPKVLDRGGPRMPVIISGNKVQEWLDPTLSKEEIENFFTPYDSNLMIAYTVPPLTGKDGVGNSESAIKHLSYPELNTLF